MPELSTILRQRLRAADKPALPHPDADVLTAFAEELLPPGEREQVLKHLAFCGDCRDVVAVTMPDALAPAEQEQEVLVAAPSRRRRWFMTPAFGMAGSIAVMILGLALILQLPQKKDQRPFSSVPVQQAKTQPSPAMSAAAPAEPAKAEQPAVVSEAQLAPPPALATAPARTDSSNSGAGAARPSSAPEAKPGTRAASNPVITADLRKQDYVNRTYLNAFEPQMAPPGYGDLPQAPMPSQPKLGFAPPSVVAGSSLQAQNFDLTANAGKNQGVVTLYPSPSQDHVGILSKIVDVGKRPLGKRPGAPIPTNSLSASAMFKPQSSVAGDALAAKSAEQASGGMLAQSPAFSSTLSFSRRALLTPSPYQWKVVDGKLLKSGDLRNWSEENPAAENVQFSVVSANGPEIWAGGKDAALMHSHDGGATWERVTLGASATGTINSIEAAGLNLHVRSSSGQSWVSQDGGKSWSLQD